MTGERQYHFSAGTGTGTHYYTHRRQKRVDEGWTDDSEEERPLEWELRPQVPVREDVLG
jgi:hypothetical protein